MKTVYLAPSDFPWLFDACPRCYWRKCNGFQKPRSRSAAMHLGSAFDVAAKKHLMAAGAKEIGAPFNLVDEIPRERVTSKSIPFEDFGVSFVIRGNLDRAFVTDEDEVVIVDFKAGVSDPDDFWAQLMLYLYSVENPASGVPREVVGLGIVGLDFKEPRLKISQGHEAALIGSIRWHPIEINRERLLAKLEVVAEVASSSRPPDAGKWCDFCRCIELAKEMDMKAVAA